MSALIDTISEKIIILSLLNVHFLVSITDIRRPGTRTQGIVACERAWHGARDRGA